MSPRSRAFVVIEVILFTVAISLGFLGAIVDATAH